MNNNVHENFAERVHVNQQEFLSELRRRFDYIVCGAGTSGSVVAARLAADPKTQVKDLIAGLKMAREIGNSAALRPFTGREIALGFLNAAELESFFRDGLSTFWHQSGTAKMGRDALSVVDGKLTVYGVDGLRISDASILPRVTTGNTMAPCVVIGERAAEILRTDRKA